MGEVDIVSFHTGGSAAKVSLLWRKWLRTFNYFVEVEDVPDDTHLLAKDSSQHGLIQRKGKLSLFFAQ